MSKGQEPVDGERRAQRQVFRALLGVDKSVIERVDVEDGGDVLSCMHGRPGQLVAGAGLPQAVRRL